MTWRWMTVVLLSAAAAVFAAGCAQREHKKVTVIHETQEGEVQEEQPGEMVVE